MTAVMEFSQAAEDGLSRSLYAMTREDCETLTGEPANLRLPDQLAKEGR